jgi:hypothetical protein
MRGKLGSSKGRSGDIKRSTLCRSKEPSFLPENARRRPLIAAAVAPMRATDRSKFWTLLGQFYFSMWRLSFSINDNGQPCLCGDTMENCCDAP